MTKKLKPALRAVKALTFDVFGTVVDWRGSIARESINPHTVNDGNTHHCNERRINLGTDSAHGLKDTSGCAAGEQRLMHRLGDDGAIRDRIAERNANLDD